ncbi:Reeler domain containing protein 1 [Sarcoptes scabiei]|uniref:Reeler domain containing protein 1 n=1 Tax=Sarcoptes scabiei TaxID=52283 RepID=A0A131ZYA6_SARSC|nr:Reeler domain containing protein 1 [Sarcoptes scabiei]
MIKNSIFFWLTISLCFYSVRTWPSGAPEKTCPTLLPRHSGTPAKEANESPFMMEQSNSHYKPGDQIKVVLKSPQNVPFRGLMVQAIDPESGQTIGSFSPGRGLKTIDSCSSVTHSDNRNKRAAILVWNAPTDGKEGHIIFRGTVVRKFDTFYKGLISLVNPNL